MTRRILLAIALLAALSASAWGQITFKPEGPQGVKPKETGPEFRTDRDDFEQALAVYQTGDTKTAMTMCDAVIATYKGGPWVERAMLLKARAYYRLNDLAKSEQALADLKKDFPATTLGAEISDLQMAIADARVGKKKYSRVRALEKMVENNPYGPRSDEAQFNIGQYYLEQKKYQDAVDAFTLVLIHYADSRYREDAMFLRAKAAYLDNEGPQRDPLPFEEASQGLQDYLKEYPNGKNAKQANTILDRVNNALAQRLYLVAEYYRKQKHARAGERYYEAVITRYPKTPWAKMSRTWVPVDWDPPQPKGQQEEAAPAEEKPSTGEKPGTTIAPPDETKPEAPATSPDETKPVDVKPAPDATPEEKPAETPAPAEGNIENK